jgi:hypothetical protein
MAAPGSALDRSCGAKLNTKISFRVLSATEQTADFGPMYFSCMPATRKPDPEMLPVHCPRCPKCHTRMITVAIASGPEGFELHSFECRKCGHLQTETVACDPLKSDAVGWIAGELRPPQ